MTPKLIVIAGPLEGMNFPITKTPITLGRELTNQICISDLSVSRHHCSIHREGDRLLLHDNDSLNATYVNGLPIKQHQLKTGDRIRMGDSLLLFLSEGEQASAGSTQVQLNLNQTVANNTVLLRRTNDPEASSPAVPASPAGSAGSAGPAGPAGIDVRSRAFTTSRETADLNALLKLSVGITAFRQSEALMQHLLQVIGSVIPAERGAILLTEEESEEITSFCGWQRSPGPQSPIQVSSTVVHQVLRDGVALLSNDVSEDAALRKADSLASFQVSSVLAAPLSASDKTLGVLYLDALGTRVEFDHDHLELLRAVAGMAAVALDNLRRLDRLENENHRLRAEISIEHDMVGQSPKMREVYQFISKAAPTEATVLIRGESGTGKELAARAVHSNSQRAGKPFVAINCAALTETLLESELFGYEKGAFTGATAQKKGKLEVAQGGTVFLDEIGEMAPQLQAKLLRVLQEREFERVGGTRPLKVDIRIIAATNRHLEQAIKDGRFREDLFFRLNVIALNLPPLRERREDIRLLANYFAAKYSQRCKRKITGITPEALTCLMNYEWPGNVREFENAIERAIVLGSTEQIRVDDLPEAMLETRPEPTTTTTTKSAPRNFYDAVNEAKKQLIINALAQAKGSYTEAARLLEMHPNHLHRLIRNLNMKDELKK